MRRNSERPRKMRFAALGYNAVNLIAHAITRAGSADPEKIRAALASIKEYNGVTGKKSCTPHTAEFPWYRWRSSESSRDSTS